MNINVRLSQAAVFLLLNFLATFAAGWQYGKNHVHNEVICLPQKNVASVVMNRLKS